MAGSLNHEQTKSLANFFLDVGKGFILGGIGFSVVAPIHIKATVALISIMATYWCLRFALFLLEDTR